MGVISSKNREQILVASLILFVLECASNTQAEVDNGFDISFSLNDIGSEMDDTPTDPELLQQFSKENLDKASSLLAKLLLIPWPKNGSPLIYVEKPSSISEFLDNEPSQDYHADDNVMANGDNLRPVGSKRSKYYRKYPWKRQQNNMRIAEELENDSLTPKSPKRSKYYRNCSGKRHNILRYEPAYMCTPNKEDVYRLLVAIHGERDGYKGQLVDFCNRKRPASLVFTNIRYVG